MAATRVQAQPAPRKPLSASPPTRKKTPPPRRAQRSLLASRPCRACISSPTTSTSSALGADRHRVLPGRRRLRCTGPAARSATARSSALRFLLGGLGYAVPAALVARRGAGPGARAAAAGPPAADRRDLPDRRDRRSRSPPGTLGIGPGAPPARCSGTRRRSRPAAGSLGQARVLGHLAPGLDRSAPTSSRSSCSSPGSILVTGATLAGRDPRRAGAASPRPADALRRTSAGTVRAHRGHRRRPPPRPARATTDEPPAPRRRSGRSALPPEPDTVELVVRATHVEAPPITDELAGDRGRPTIPEPEPDSTSRSRRARIAPDAVRTRRATSTRTT